MLEERKELKDLLDLAEDLERWRGKAMCAEVDYRRFQERVEGLLRRVWGRYDYGSSDDGWRWLMRMRQVLLGFMERLYWVQYGLQDSEDGGMERVQMLLSERDLEQIRQLGMAMNSLLLELPAMSENL